MTTTAHTGADRPIVIAQRLTKVFKDFWLRRRVVAVNELDFEIRRGQIFGLIGPNGSGKSTTIKMILGLLHKTGGRLAVFGQTPQNVAIKKHIGYLPEESYLYPFLNARETLDFYGKLFGLSGRVRERRIDELLEMVGLDAVQYRPIGEYSKGMQRRIGIAQALINDPDFLILDEPTSGLDPIGIRQVKDLILHLGGRGKTILLSSHLLADVEDVCDYMVMLYGGRKQREGTRDDLLTTRERTVIETDALDDATIEKIRQLIDSSSPGSNPATRVEPARQSLEALFLDIVNKAQSERIETFGARAGGQTAAFLGGTDSVGDEAEGDALLERLTSAGSKDADATSGPVSTAATAGNIPSEGPRKPEGADESILESLVADAPAGESSEAEHDFESKEAPESDEERREAVSDSAAADPEVDSSVIDSLLDSSSDDEQEKRENS